MTRSHGLRRTSRLALGVCLALSVSAPASLLGQDTPELVTVSGQVVDRTTGAPIEGVFVQPPRPYGGQLTDAAGLFRLRLPAGEDHDIRAQRLGYATLEFVLAAHELGMTLRLEMEPEAIELPGIEVYSRGLSYAFEQRRNAMVGVVQGYHTDQILEIGGDDGFEFYDRVSRTGRPCFRAFGWCALTPRGERPIRICIDGLPAWGGVEQLRDYAPEELYLVEVDASEGHVRAYTQSWMRSRFSRSMAQMDPVVRANPNVQRSAAFLAAEEAFNQC